VGLWVISFIHVGGEENDIAYLWARKWSFFIHIGEKNTILHTFEHENNFLFHISEENFDIAYLWVCKWFFKFT